MSAATPLPIAVLLSGGGRTLQNLLARRAASTLDVDVRLVIASTSRAGGLEHARAAGIPGEVIRRRDFSDDDAFSAANFAAIRGAGAELVALAGYLKFLPIPADFENRVVNIHPALFPAFCGHGFYGHHVHEAVLEYGARVSGCTVHFVDNEYDHGPILLQRCVRVESDDTPASLADRIFAEEQIAYPEALQLHIDRQ